MDEQKICDLARMVIDIEAKVINSLKERITPDFATACTQLYQAKGRIIVMGVGKSGHIGKKIAATFASTGSPSFFIHPNEAGHGDMGMLTPEDALLAISHSGESDEIIAILPAIKRLKIPLIALTGKPHSTLAKAATVHIDVSVSQEACPLGLAPTSSTTAALVMGDALAMALLETRGFTAQDFAFSHPGGALGRRLLLRVDSLMHQQEHMPKIADKACLQDALIEMTRKKLGMTTIVNQQGELVGIFTDGDLRRVLDKNLSLKETPVISIMSAHPKTIAGDALATEALQIMEQHQITSLVVIGAAKPIGVIHIHDILRAGVV